MSNKKLIDLNTLVVSKETGLASREVLGIIDIDDPALLEEIGAAGGIDIQIDGYCPTTNNCNTGGAGAVGGEGS